MGVPKRVVERMQAELKSYQSILAQQKARDVSEADTVTIVKDILSDLFGYDKYGELTSEFSIRGTYCDLAIKVDGKLAMLIEVKAIGIDLKDSHVKQAIDYAANQGCEWVVLTNGVEWRLYHVVFSKPIDKEDVATIDLLASNARSADDLERLFLLSREGFTKNALAEYRDRKDATSRFMLAAIILHADSVQNAIRREVRRVSELLVEPEIIAQALRDQVIKREALEGEQAEAAAKRVKRMADRSLRPDIEKNPDPCESAGATTVSAPAQGA